EVVVEQAVHGLTAVLERYGGKLAISADERLIGVFGAASVHEDDALRAMRASLEARRVLTSEMADMRRRYGVSLTCRFGVATGEALVGRDEELRQLAAACAVASHERVTTLVTVIGEAGIGKTRLLYEVERRLGHEMTVLTGHCLSYGEGITFWPLRELIRQASGGHD